MSVVIVGSRPDSVLYVEKKQKACKRIGVLGETIAFPEDIEYEALKEAFEGLNKDPSVYGILLQVFSVLSYQI